MSSPPSKIQVQKVGDTVRLNCSAGGSPLPKVTWFKDGQRIVSTAVFDGNNVIKSEFVIYHFKPSDAGMYTCLFYNEKNVTAEANTSLSMSIFNMLPVINDINHYIHYQLLGLPVGSKFLICSSYGDTLYTTTRRSSKLSSRFIFQTWSVVIIPVLHRTDKNVARDTGLVNPYRLSAIQDIT